MTKLFPICRSITGDGVRVSHQIIGEYIPLETHDIPTGTKAFDWEVPKEWNIEDAYVLDPEGKKIIDFHESNLHVINYSAPIDNTISFDKLKLHLHTLPEQPDVIPYLTSYYDENWGFCLSHEQFLTLKDGDYKVKIESSLTHGSLTYSECLLKGKTNDEVLITCYTCHPSLCNDNLSGVVLATQLAKLLVNRTLKYSYRFLFIPETIGAITWLSQNEDKINLIKHGLVITCVGDSGNFTYKKSRNGNAEIDRTVTHVLKHSEEQFNVVDFFPSGSDERQFCSPGFNLQVGSLMRSSYTKFPEYHTSADNLDFVRPEYLGYSLEIYLKVINVLENNIRYTNVNPKCEPQLGKRGLYNKIGGQNKQNLHEFSMLWVLNYSDGKHSLLDIAELSGLEFEVISQTATLLKENKLLIT
jgi:aminopeptidase-like protein